MFVFISSIERNIQLIAKLYSDVKEMEKLGFKAAPMLEVNGKIMNYSEAIKWVNNF